MENSVEELKQRLEELYQTQQAGLDVGADDLDIREEIAEVEEAIKDLQDEITEGNSLEKDEALKVIGKRYMLWNIQRQVYALKLKDRTVTEEWLIDILDSLEKMQLVEEDNWNTKKYIESEIEQDMIRESKILNKRIRGLIKWKKIV